MTTGCYETRSSTACFCWVRSRARALSFHFDDAALGFCLAADFLGGLEVGDVYGIGAVLLELAAADRCAGNTATSPAST